MSYASMLRGLYNNMDSKSKYFIDDVGLNMPVLGAWLKAQNNIDYAEDYLRNTGMDWSDIKYHKLDLGLGSAVGGTVNFVSSNVASLYKHKKR